ERGAKILLIPMHYPGDDQITSELYQLLDAPDSVSIFPKGRSVEQVIAAIGELDLLIGVRLHALVFAAIATTPAIAISYDPKVDQFAERMEQVNIGPLSTVSAEAIWQEACYHLDEGDKIRERTRRLSTKLRLEALHNATLAAELLAKGDFQPPQPSS
ncbi:MAG: polysaccharide pyruvyl transferase family protein, partial [Symbiobacteriaceae bacterium]|nr:polysaccharide pyruvyl transferase family protein [Symbiobacteriaceae bacterium]